MGSNLIPPKMTSGTPEEYQALNTFLADVARTLNGGMRLAGQGNVSQRTIVANFPSGAGAVLPIEHKLGRIPEGFTVIKNPDSAIIGNADTAPSKDRIYLKSDVPGARVTLLFF